MWHNTTHPKFLLFKYIIYAVFLQDKFLKIFDEIFKNNILNFLKTPEFSHFMLFYNKKSSLKTTF